MIEKAARNFALGDANGNEKGVFAGKSPRQAALKAANRGITDIRLRERGTKKVHIFTGEWNQVKKPKVAPAWMLQRSGNLMSRRSASRSLKNFEDAFKATLKPPGYSKAIQGSEAIPVSMVFLL